MNENSYLNPIHITEQCNNAIQNLEKDNEAIRIAEQNLNTFLNDTELKSKAYEALRQQMSDYATVLQAMRTANHYDMADFSTLKASVGEEELIGGQIIEQKALAEKQKQEDMDKVQKYEKKAGKAVLPWEKWYYGWKADQYWDMAEIDRQLYNRWQAKQDRYDKIEAVTNGLFQSGVSLRAAAEAGFCGIAGAFQNGVYVPDKNAAWRADLAKCYIERMITVNADGTITAKWEEVEKVLHKPAGEITQEEYEALALLYLNLDETELSHFLKLCMDKKEDVNVPWYNEVFGLSAGLTSEDYSEWTVNQEKIKKLLEQVEFTSDKTLERFRQTDSKNEKEQYRLLERQRNIIVQRMTLLKVTGEIGTFRGTYQAQYPTITIKQNEDQSLTLQFCQFRNIGSEAAPTMSNLGKSTVNISKTKNGEIIDQEALEKAELSFCGYFGEGSWAKDTCNFVIDETTGEMVSQGAEQLGAYVAERTGKEALKNVIGYVPIAGDIAVFALDMTVAQKETEEAQNFITGQFDSLESAMIYSTFDCSVNFVQYEKLDNNQLTLYTQTGRNTAEKVRSINEALGTQITEADVVKNPNEISALLKKLFVENPENEDRYNDALRND